MLIKNIFVDACVLKPICDTVNIALRWYNLCEAEGIALKYTLCETSFRWSLCSIKISVLCCIFHILFVNLSDFEYNKFMVQFYRLVTVDCSPF